MSVLFLHKITPPALYKTLWGDRKSFGIVPEPTDPEWVLWHKNVYTDFYQKTQQRGIGNKVNRMAYPVARRIDFTGKRVLEIGPGIIRHLSYMKGKPAGYTICDVNQDVLYMALKQLKDAGIESEAKLICSTGNIKLPFDNGAFDVVVCFYALEHFYPLDMYLSEFKRVLRDGGEFLGGIPCEGGLAWGLGRFFTTRRYVHKNYKINYDKIICWEHPNFADLIIGELDSHFQRIYLRLHPFPFLPMDLNLVASFIYTKYEKY